MADDAEPIPRKRTWAYRLGALAVLAFAGWSIWAGFTATNVKLSDFCQKVATPIATTMVGWLAADYYFRREANKKIEKDVSKAAYSTRIMLQGMYEVDARMSNASNHLNEGKRVAATAELSVAVAVTRLVLWQVAQSLREWEHLSKAGADAAKKMSDADKRMIVTRQQIKLDAGQTAGDAT
ncbi:hypothetical protein [Mycobacterium riyadhense]|uniref:hypothetical protein n=1 Tax=Mycobacterium riyadhense TaxID=486698 RepID=UPI0019564B02|nr:hypothetical protein [Mycobacterium riyadhense]